MIYFLTTRRARYTIGVYLKNVAPDAQRWLTPLTYERWLTRRRHLPGVYVLSDIERLSPRQASRAAAVCDELAGAGPCRVLNYPLRSLRRFELLRTLQSRGANRFNVYRPAEANDVRRYPVFVRGENDHKGPQSPLLANREALDQTLRHLGRRWKGWRPKIITEFCDTADAQGVYRKFSAFKIGDRIIPRGVFFSQHWMVKTWGLTDDALLEEERRYVFTNPHEAELRDVFRLARIDYGRIDYALQDGALQTWEINTNPSLPSGYSDASAPRKPVLAWFRDQLHRALQELDGLASAPAAVA